MTRNAMLVGIVASLILAIISINLGIETFSKTSIFFRSLSAVFFIATIILAVRYHRKSFTNFKDSITETELKKAQEKIASARSTLKSIMDNIDAGIIETDLEGNILISNAYAKKVIGTDGEKLRINNIFEFPAPIFEQEALRRKYNDLKEFDKPFTSLRTLRNTQGNLVQWSTTNALLKDEEMNPTGFLLIGRDVTEKQKLHAQLIHNERLRAIGEMAAGIAHELNNMLSPVFSYAQMLQTISDDEQITKRARTMEEQSARAVNIVKGLLTYARQSGDVFVNLSLESLIDETLILLKYQLQKARIQVLKDYDEIGEVEGNSSKLQQVLVNVIVNAKHAMPEGGQLMIKTYQDEFNAYIDITDTGTGIPHETLDNIFEPFFTTRKNEGTGLGLSICKEIINEHHGTIKVNSQMDIGSTFIIILPLASVPIKIKQ